MRFSKIEVRGLGPFSHLSLDLDAIPGRLVAVTGANGEGKSTLLELLAGALYRDTPTRGSLADLATARDAFVEVTAVNGSSWTIRQSVDNVSRKGESLVTDAAGRPALPSAKVAEFDSWAKAHLLAPEVLYASTFGAQGSGGFLDMKPAERKGVLLRVLGVERLERLAEGARDRARSSRSSLDVLAGRIADERARGGDLEALRSDLGHAQEQAAIADAALVKARDRVADLEANAEGSREAVRIERLRLERLADLQRRHAAATVSIEKVETRIRNNVAVLEEREAIERAVARLGDLDRELLEVDRELGAKRAAQTEALRQVDEARRTAAREAANAGAARGRADRARARLRDREAVDAAAASLEALRTAARDAREGLAVAEAALEELRGKRVDGAETRIVGLRKGLAAVIREPEHAEHHARDAISTDDETVKLAAELPANTAAAVKDLSRLAALEADARQKVIAAERLAERARELDVADADAKNADAEAIGFAGAAALATAAGEEHQFRVRALDAEISALAARRADLTADRELAEPLARKAEPLAAAQTRLSELEPQRDSLRSELTTLAEQLAEVEAQAPPATPSDLEAELRAARTATETAEATAKRAHGVVATVTGAITRAEESALKLKGLLEVQAAADEQLGDWTRLAEDLGKDGIQALEIDAAGPELTALINDLLHTCIGTRWTVTVETQRLSGDGKKMLEGCEVRVLDTERGRDAAAETLSGGERVLVGEAISLALSMLSCRRAGVTGATLVRDETGAALDPANGRAYLAMLRRAAEIVGASKVLFVAHDAALQELADARIVVAGGTVQVCS